MSDRTEMSKSSRPVPPPSILFLLSWTGFTAVLLALQRVRYDLGSPHGQVNWFQYTGMLHAAFTALAIAGLANLLFAGRLGGAWQPGYWLLLITTARVVGYVPSLVMLLVPSEIVLGLGWAGSEAIAGVVIGFAVASSARPWRWLFLALLVQAALSAITGLLIAIRWFPFVWISELGSWVFFATGIGLLCLLFVEWSRKIERNWYHFLGAGQMLGTVTVYVLNEIALELGWLG